MGVLLGILGGGVPPGSPNPDPFSDQNLSFFTPVSRPGLYEIPPSLLTCRLEPHQESFLKIHFEFFYFCFFLTHLELKQ